MILLPPFKGTQVKSRSQVYINDKEERVKNPSSRSPRMENKEPQIVGSTRGKWFATILA